MNRRTLTMTNLLNLTHTTSVARTLRSTRCASRCPATRILGTSGAGSNLTPRAAAVHGNLVSSGNAVCAQAVTLGAKSGSSADFVEPSQRSKTTITPRVRPDRFCCEAAIHDSDTAAQTLCCRSPPPLMDAFLVEPQYIVWR